MTKACVFLGALAAALASPVLGRMLGLGNQGKGLVLLGTQHRKGPHKGLKHPRSLVSGAAVRKRRQVGPQKVASFSGC